MTEQETMASINDDDDERIVFLYTANVQGRRDIPRNVTHIRLAENVQVLPLWSLSKLTRLERLEFSQNGIFQILGRSALLGCVSLEALTLPPSTLEIRAGALAGCFQLASIHLNHGLVRILDSAFQHCRSLDRMRIPPSVKSLGNLAFHGCHSLCMVDLPNNLQYLGRGVFMQCNSLQCIQVPPSVVYIGAYCFKDCFRLQSVELAPTGLEMIRAEAFRNCPNLRNICLSQETVLEGGYANVFDTDTMLIARHDDEIPDLDLGEDVEFWQFAQEGVQKPISIQNRYDKLPIHKLCYYQAHWSSLEESQEGTKSIVEEMKQLLESGNIFDQQDHVFMTPLHILALSTTPNWELWELIYQAFPDHLFVKDKWGKEPLQYLLDSNIEDDAALETILRHVIPARLHRRLECLGDSCEAEFLEWIDTLSIGTKVSRRSSANRILEKCCQYEFNEALSLLDSAVLKAEWGRMSIVLNGTTTTSATRRDESGLVSMASNWPDGLGWEEARETCRVQCGSGVVVSNVMQFLDPVEEFHLDDPIALF